MLYCPQCGTPNKSNSKFCKNCAALLQPSTDIRCPICGTSNPQDAATCKSCGTRLSTSAAGMGASDKLSPADAPETITPFNPPELSQDADAPGEKPSGTFGARPAFSRSNSEWLRRIGKTPRAEPAAATPTETPPPAPAPAEPASSIAAPKTDTPDWLRELQAEADRQQAAQKASVPEQPAPPKPQLSEIKLTGDDYDYSDIGGQVTDEMKAQLEAEAGKVESVEDEVALARRLLGLDVGAETAAAAKPETSAPARVETTPPTEPLAQIATPPAPEIETRVAPTPTEPIEPIATPPAPEPVAQIVTPPAKPQLSEIKLTGDDYDYSDIGGQVTDEMKAQLEAEASKVESVEDEVALARRLLGLEVEQVPAASKPKTEAPEPVIAQKPKALQEPSAPVAPIAETPVETVAAQPVQEKEQAGSPEWLAALAAASSAAVAANVLRDAAETKPEPEPIETAPREAIETAPVAAEAAVESEPQVTETVPVAAVEAPAQPTIVRERTSEPPAPVIPPLASGTLPEWLRVIVPPDEVIAKDQVAAEDEPPAWVKELAPSVATLGPAALVSHLPDLNETERGDLPDWLREPVAPATPEPEPAAASTEPPEIVREPQYEGPVELPAWMRAGAPITRDAFEVVETTGPLAGVSGVLPLAVALMEPHTLATPTPARSEGGRIFQTILAEPLAPAARAERAARAKNIFTLTHLLYLLIALAALIPFLPLGLDELGLVGKEVVNSPSAVFYDQLTAVPANSTVLMAFEYTPGASPELDPAARVILENLIARQANVIALSSNPSGAAIAQALLGRAQETHPEFTFVNLGYIPGNAQGLKSLAKDWRRASDVDVNGVPWSQTPLSKTIHGMDDFALHVLLLGDNPALDTWMMQVQPAVQAPMVAATTAAIDPQARVYVNAKQLNASLRGLTGAAELELWSANPGQAVKTVNALSFVSLVLAGIIIAANVVWLMRRGKA
ncbi:MAG: zinc ribbon domain-containing protein [Chloroflexi bacterium]|nr:zinc ribbon domain-containing protein [Chloroflexota bacterium]